MERPGVISPRLEILNKEKLGLQAKWLKIKRVKREDLFPD